MRRLHCLMVGLLCIAAVAQDGGAPLTPEAQVEAQRWEPGTNYFYINGVGHRYAADASYAVVAAAVPEVAGKYLAVKVHVFNRSRQSITVRPDDVDLIDAVANRRVDAVAPVEVANRKLTTVLMKFAAATVAGPQEQVPDAVDPQWSSLVRVLQPEVQSSQRLYWGTAGRVRESYQFDGPDCDTACQLRNREANSTLSWNRQETLAECILHTAFLANTIPPQGDVEGVVYFPMPHKASTDLSARRRSKSYAATLSVQIAGEHFHLDFPVD